MPCSVVILRHRTVLLSLGLCIEQIYDDDNDDDDVSNLVYLKTNINISRSMQRGEACEVCSLVIAVFKIYY